MNLVAGTLIAIFGSAERYLARVAAFLGEADDAEERFAAALEMDRQTRAVVHLPRPSPTTPSSRPGWAATTGPGTSPARHGNWPSRSARRAWCDCLRIGDRPPVPTA